MKVTQCKSCKAAIIFGKMQASGKPMPFDAAPAQDGKFFVTDSGVSVHVESSCDLASKCRATGARKYTSHFVTCPNRDKHRKGRAPSEGDEGFVPKAMNTTYRPKG